MFTSSRKLKLVITLMVHERRPLNGSQVLTVESADCEFLHCQLVVLSTTAKGIEKFSNQLYNIAYQK